MIRVNNEYLDSLRNSGDYIYNSDTGLDELSFSEIAWRKFLEWLGDLFDTVFKTGLSNFITIAFILLVLGFLIYQFARNRTSSLVSLSSDESLRVELVRNAKKEEFDKLIKDAILKKDFNDALRYYFLKTLSVLNTNNKIKFSENKTNRDYYYEIEDVILKSQFQRLMSIFDFTFYGEVEANKSQFEKAESLFKEFLENPDLKRVETE